MGFGSRGYPSRTLHYGDNVNDLTSFEIRLLKVLPRLNDSQLECSLTIQRLHSDSACLDQQYIALSYAWGTQPSEQSITISGAPFEPTQNLHDALHHISASLEETAFWIDAICINQNDIHEKTHQISVMRYVYELAQKTIIWLGSRDDECVEAMSLVSRLARLGNDICDTILARDGARPSESSYDNSLVIQAFFEELKWNSSKTKTVEHWIVDGRDGIKGSPVETYYDRIARTDNEFVTREVRQKEFYEALNAYDLSSRHSDSWNGLSKLLNREWFRRIWVVQEVSISPNPIVLYRQKTTTWDELVVASKLLYELHAAGATDFHSSFSHEAVYVVHSLNGQREMFRNEERPELLELVRLFRPFLSTKPEDKIIGLQGLTAHHFKADYKLGAARLFSEFAASTMLEYSRLSVLHDVCCHHGNSDSNLKVGSMPSWAPDWSSSGVNAQQPWGHMSTFASTLGSFRASTDSEQDPILLDGLRLRLPAYFIDTVTAIMEAKDASQGQQIMSRRVKYGTGIDNFQGLSFVTGYDSSVMQLLNNFRLIRRLLRTKDYPTGQSQNLAFFKVVFSPFPTPSNKASGIVIWVLRTYFCFGSSLLRMFTSSFGKPTMSMWYILLPFITGSVVLGVVVAIALIFALEIPILVLNHTFVPVFRRRYFASVFSYIWHEAKNIRHSLWVVQGQWREHWGFANRNLDHERLSRTRKGYIGYVNCDARCGDTIVFFSGASMPSVIRQTDRGWLLISNAVVHGLMNGEGLRVGKPKDIVLV
ncbi:HET-domain-containing protein [Lophiostoma macrostomum CBS 122681]|uniref:HET-domain-containing protein n=1 Tax=Lophiostoma macrostomum CBS 122681 TaxID=1314788 RepID=A0A6A6TAQ1_9PLEO|nr:HET-domain-containing protein [Lophiostoma macrostomum CBS 122681]